MFKDQASKYDDHINYFIKPIYERKKRRFSLIEWLRLRKFLKELKSTSPNFNMLVEIYHFIKVLSDVYSYHDSEKNGESVLYTIIPNGYNNSPDLSFGVRRNALGIIYKLWYDNDTGWIEVVKSNDIRDSKSRAATFKFKDGESVIENTDQENMFINIITITMDAVAELVEYYWKNKFRGY